MELLSEMETAAGKKKKKKRHAFWLGCREREERNEVV